MFGYVYLTLVYSFSNFSYILFFGEEKNYLQTRSIDDDLVNISDKG